MKGILVYIYRDASSNFDATKGGLTSKFTCAVLVGEDVPQHVEATEELPGLVLVKRTITPQLSAGPAYEYLHAEPADLNQQGALCAFGGNFVHTSDSRFPSMYPIPVHDYR
jgi:hypothetical protein